jgi:predicted kinase
MLIIFGGLPGTGKSTIARLLAKRLKATYLRIDTIEQTLRACSTPQAAVTSEGYLVAYHVAGDDPRTGGTVIADSVNPVAETRAAWRAVAAAVEIETICSDPHEHRRRVETASPTSPAWSFPRGTRSCAANTSHGPDRTWSLTPRPAPKLHALTNC